MKGYKQIIRNICRSKIIASLVVDISLRLHNSAYYLAGAISQGLESNGLHPKHRILDYHQWFSSKLQPDWNVLDIGCGNGALAGALITNCRRIVGIDIDPEKIREAKAKNPNPNIEFRVGDATSYAFFEKFEAVVLSNVLEHIKHRAEFLKNISKYSDNFLVRIPMIDRDWITLYKKERGIPYLLDPAHFIEYTFESFSTEMNNAGLSIIEHRVRYGELYSVCRKWG